MKLTSAMTFGLTMSVASALCAADDSAKPRTMANVHIAECQITLIDHVTLASDRSGILKHVEFKEGQSVVSGSQVALIEDDVAKANLAVAEKKASNEVEVKFAKVAREAAKNEYDMARKANEKSGGKSVSALDIDKALLAFQKADLSIEQAEHELALNKLNRDVTAEELKTYSVIAGFAGIVTKVYKKKHEAVRQGDPVVDIVNTDRVRIEGRVPLAQLRYARQGAKVRVKLSIAELDLPEEEEEFEGKITFVDLVSEKLDNTTRVFAEVQNRDNILRAGLQAEMEIEVEDQATANQPKAGNDGQQQKKLAESLPKK